MNIDNLIKELESEESKDIIKKIAEERILKENKKNERINILMSTIDYIDWLIKFTNDNNGFSDDDWTYAYEKLDPKDMEKVNELSLFYEGIFRYARENYIYSISRPFGDYYPIRVGDIGFEIGMMTGQGTKFYCNRVTPNENFIDYIDILTNKKQDNVDYIKENLDLLSGVINRLYESGVPFEAIESAINKAMGKIVQSERNKETNDQKVLSKKA